MPPSRERKQSFMVKPETGWLHGLPASPILAATLSFRVAVPCIPVTGQTQLDAHTHTPYLSDLLSVMDGTPPRSAPPPAPRPGAHCYPLPPVADDRGMNAGRGVYFSFPVKVG